MPGVLHRDVDLVLAGTDCNLFGFEYNKRLVETGEDVGGFLGFVHYCRYLLFKELFCARNDFIT